MPYAYALVHSLSGVEKIDVTDAVVAEPRWKTAMPGPSEWSVDLHLRGSDVFAGPAEARKYTAHWMRTFVVSWVAEDGGETAVAAGLVKRHEFDDDSGVLTLTVIELRCMLDWRMVSDVAGYFAAGMFTLSGKSLRGLVRGLIQAGLRRAVAEPFWDFPINLGADEAGSLSMAEPFFEMATIEQILSRVQAPSDGPDVHFDPHWLDQKTFEWRLVIGSPRIDGAAFEWSQSAADSPISSPRVVSDGTQMTTGVLVAGQGSDESMRVGKGGWVGGDPGIPWRDRSIAAKSVEDQAELDALGAGELASNTEPAVVKTFALDITDDIDPAALRIGSNITVTTDGNEYEMPGEFTGDLVAVGSGGPGRLTLEVLPL